MSTIITRNSATSGSVPSSLIQGELAINVKDGRLFYGSGSGNVVREFTGSGGGGGTVNTGSFVTTSSFNAYTGSNTSQFAGTASYALNALSASYAPSTPAFPYTGSAGITGSLTVVGKTQSTQIGAGTSPSGSVPLDVKAQGALSTDLALRVRNSADTNTILSLNGLGAIEVRSNAVSIAQSRRLLIGGTNTDNAVDSSAYDEITMVGYNNINANYRATLLGSSNTCNVQGGSPVVLVGYGNTSTNGGNIILGKSNTGQATLIIGTSNAANGGGAGSGIICVGNSNTISAANGYPTLPMVMLGSSVTIPNSIAVNNCVFLSAGADGTDPYVTFKKNNISIGSLTPWTTNFDNNSTGTFYTKVGVAPTTMAAGTIAMYAASSSAGNAKPYFRTENGTIVSLGDQSQLYNVTASSITSSFTGSLLGTASYATNALSASYAPSTPAFPYTGSAGITGSLTVVGPTTSTQIGAGAAPSGSIPLDVRAQGALSTDLAFRIRNSANNANLGAIYGNGTVNLGNSNFDFQSTETSGRTAVIGASNTGASYSTYSILSILGHNNSIASYGHTSYVGINSSINQNSGGTVTGMGESNTLVGGTIGIGMNNNIAGSANSNMNTGIGYNNAIQYEKKNTFLLGNNLRITAAGNASMTKIGWANSVGTLAEIDRSFEVYLNGQSGSDFHVTGKTNVVLKNNSVLVSGTNYEAAATNTLTIHNGVAPITNITGAFQLYSTASTAGNAKPHFRTENGTTVWLGDESRLFNVTASRTIISSSQNTISGSSLTVYGSGSAQPIFTVQGSQGELFSITDSLSGSLFSVNDISGLPIMEVFSDNTTLMGSYLAPSLNTTAKVVQTNSGSFTMYSLPTASYDTAFFEYSVRSGSNARAGTIMAIQSGSAVNFTETTTTDFGSTSAVSFTVIVTGSNIALTGSSTSGAWTIKTIVRSI